MYEDHDSEWIDESWRQRPAPYNRTTLDAERSALSYTEQGGEGIVLRFAGFYSDSVPFSAHVPTLFLSTSIHDDYHRPGDTVAQVDLAQGERAVHPVPPLVPRPRRGPVPPPAPRGTRPRPAGGP